MLVIGAWHSTKLTRCTVGVKLDRLVAKLCLLLLGTASRQRDYLELWYIVYAVLISLDVSALYKKRKRPTEVA